MAFVYSDRVKEQSSSVGLVAMVLTGALPGFKPFSTGIGDANQTYYTIFNTADDTWEVGSGTYTSGSNSLSRDTVLASSNSNLPVSFIAGTKTVFSTVAAQFFGSALTAITHTTLNHSGVLGVPSPETFAAGDHDLVDHTVAPFQLLNAVGHAAVDHTAGPLSLLDEPAHDVLDHAGLTGVNNFDSVAHALIDHTVILGVPAAETFTAPVHSATDHTGLTGVGVSNTAFQASPELGAGSVHAAGRTHVFAMGIGVVKFAVCGFASHNNLTAGVDDEALITNVEFNTPGAGDVRITFTTTGPGTYDASLVFSCTAYN